MSIWHRFLLGSLLGVMGFSQPPSLVFAQAFEPPPNQDAPSSTAGGGSRPSDSSCQWNESLGSKATALAPETFVGLTRLARPTLWIYLPQSTHHGVEISVFDQHLNGLAQATLSSPIANKTGLVAFQLPSDFSLSSNTPYYWSAAIICNPERRTEDWVVGGWIQYEPTINHQTSDSETSSSEPSNSEISSSETLQDSSSVEQIEYDIDTGYWYDALTTIIPSIITPSPSPTISHAWLTLLQQANLNPQSIDL